MAQGWHHPTNPSGTGGTQKKFSQCWKKHHVQISGFCRPTKTSIITKGWKFRAILVCFFFFLSVFYIYIYICTHTHTQIHTKTSAQLHMYTIDLRTARRHVCISWLIFLQQEREINPPHWRRKVKRAKWASGLPPKKHIHLSERQRNRKHRCQPGHGGGKSTFNEAIKTEIKQELGRDSVVFSVQEYDTHMHKLTQAGHCQDCHPRGTGVSMAPAPSRRRCRSEHNAEASGTVVHLFPKEKQTKPTPKTHTHPHQTIVSPPNLSFPISGDGVP